MNENNEGFSNEKETICRSKRKTGPTANFIMKEEAKRCFAFEKEGRQS